MQSALRGFRGGFAGVSPPYDDSASGGASGGAGVRGGGGGAGVRGMAVRCGGMAVLVAVRGCCGGDGCQWRRRRRLILSFTLFRNTRPHTEE